MGESEKERFAHRKCRDCFWALLFILFWFGMVFVAYTAYTSGNPRRLYYPKDFRGNSCGVDNRDPKILDYIKENQPSLNESDYAFLTELVNETDCFFPLEDVDEEICVSACPTGIDVTDPIPNYLYGTGGDFVKEFQRYETYPRLRRCFPGNSTNETADSSIVAKIDEASQIGNLIGDLAQTWETFVVVGISAFILSFLYMLFLKKMAGFMTFLTIIAYLLSILGLYYYFGVLQSDYEAIPEDQRLESDNRNILMFKYLKWAMLVIFVLSVIIILFMLKRIRLTIRIIKEAARAIEDVPTVMAIPFFSMLAQALLYIWWIPPMIYIVASGKPELRDDDHNGYYNLYWNNPPEINYMGMYHVFGLLWTNEFIIAITKGTIAGAIGVWYWTRDKSNLGSPVMKAFKRNIRYNLGSYALGALIVAIVQVLRITAEYLEKRYKARPGPKNSLAKYAFAVLKYFLACVERLVKFINKNAYIMIAIYGESFCKSTKRAWHLITNNILRIAAVNTIGDTLLFLGKLFVTFVVGGVACIYLRTKRDVLNYYTVPLAISILIAFTIASSFMGVFEMTIDTILLSFCEDCERAPGEEPYASEKLQEFMDGVKVASKESTSTSD